MKERPWIGYEENDAFSGWRKLFYWKPGERKAAKRRSHHKDRAAARRQIRKDSM